jgi:hypothetical protein
MLGVGAFPGFIGEQEGERAFFNPPRPVHFGATCCKEWTIQRLKALSKKEQKG